MGQPRTVRQYVSCTELYVGKPEAKERYEGQNRRQAVGQLELAAKVETVQEWAVGKSRAGGQRWSVCPADAPGHCKRALQT